MQPKYLHIRSSRESDYLALGVGRWWSAVALTSHPENNYISSDIVAYGWGAYVQSNPNNFASSVRWHFVDRYACGASVREIPASLVSHSVRRMLLREMCGVVQISTSMEQDSNFYYRGCWMDNTCQADQVKRIKKQNGVIGELVGKAKSGRASEKEIDNLIFLLNDGCVNSASGFERVLKKIAGLGIGLHYATCGHMVREGEEIRVANSGGRLQDTACEECHSDPDVVVYCVDDDQHHWRDNVYFWDSDEEYHLTEENSDSDDEFDSDHGFENPNRRLSYSSDVMRFLVKDDSFASSAHGDFHMGIELETSAKDYSVIDKKVAEARQELGENYLVCKYDSSVGDLSMEWVTRPTNLKTHIEKLKSWKSCSGLIAWDNRSCGTHVHIDSKAFTALTLGKMIQFYNSEDNTDFIRAIAGRHPRRDNQAEQYASLDSSIVMVSPKAALKGKDPSRYRMINCENLSYSESRRLGLDGRQGESNTVEIRIFRASLKKERLLAQIEFAHAVVMFCRVTSYRDLTQSSFLKWLKNSAGLYPNLAKWFDINHRHGSTVTKTDPVAKAGQKAQPELFEQSV